MVFITTVLGMTFSMIFSTGLITLGAAAFYGIGAFASALLVMELGLSFWLALPLATLIVAIIALGLGSIIVRHPGVPFVLITMLFAYVVVLVTGQIEVFGGWGGIIGIPRPNSLGPVEFAGKIPCYYLMLFLLLMIALIFYALYTSRIGRVWGAIKLSPPLAESLGINLYRYRLLAFVIGSSAAGVVGSFYAHYFQSIMPVTFSGWVSIYIQFYALLGGLQFYILGPAIGAAIMTFIPEFLRISGEVEPIITGVLLLILILFFPRGILGTLQTFPRLRLASMSAWIGEIRVWLLGGGNLRR
jgi:branched-chain amino acid transport system permease protein